MPMQSGGTLGTLRRMRPVIYVVGLLAFVTWKTATLCKTPLPETSRRTSEWRRRGVKWSRPCWFGRLGAEPGIGPAWGGVRLGVRHGDRGSPWLGVWAICAGVSAALRATRGAAEEWRWRNTINNADSCDAGGGGAACPCNNSTNWDTTAGGGDVDCSPGSDGGDDADRSPDVGSLAGVGGWCVIAGCCGRPRGPLPCCRGVRRIIAGGGLQLAADSRQITTGEREGFWLSNSPGGPVRYAERDYSVEWLYLACLATVRKEAPGETVVGTNRGEEEIEEDTSSVEGTRQWTETDHRIEDPWETAGTLEIGRARDWALKGRIIIYTKYPDDRNRFQDVQSHCERIEDN